MPVYGITSNDQGQINMGHFWHQSFMPMLGTFGARWQISGFSRPWKTKPHGDNIDLRLIIKNLPAHPHPRPQPVTARIIKRDTGFVNFPARRLTGDENTRLR